MSSRKHHEGEGHGPQQHGDAHPEHDFTGPLSPGVATLLKWFGAACVALFVADFFIERKTHAPKEGIPGFYPVYGFVGCVLLVLIAKELRKVVMRDEDYYDGKGGR
jgi:hypothetical protein